MFYFTAEFETNLKEIKNACANIKTIPK